MNAYSLLWMDILRIKKKGKKNAALRLVVVACIKLVVVD